MHRLFMFGVDCRAVRIAILQAVFLALNALSPMMAAAQPVLAFSPQRVLMGDQDRTATLSLTNRGDAPGTYRIGMSDVLYHEDGTVSHTDMTPVGFPSAKPFIRFSPRQVRLRPGETQRIRILARTPDTVSGEYRVHAVLRRLPEPQAASAQESEGAVSGVVGISQAVALAIILRRGEITAHGGFRDVRRGDKTLDMNLWREGNGSLYVDLHAYRGAAEAANEITVVRGIAVPVPNRILRYRIGLQDAMAGPIRVTMTDHYTGEVIDSVLVD